MRVPDTAWRGTNGFRMMPTDELRSSPASATTSTAAGGHALILRYTWEHVSDGPQDGVVLVGSPARAGSRSRPAGATAGTSSRT